MRIVISRARISWHLSSHFAEDGKLKNEIGVRLGGIGAQEKIFILPRNAENGLNAESRR